MGNFSPMQVEQSRCNSQIKEDLEIKRDAAMLKRRETTVSLSYGITNSSLSLCSRRRISDQESSDLKGEV